MVGESGGMAAAVPKERPGKCGVNSWQVSLRQQNRQT